MRKILIILLLLAFFGLSIFLYLRFISKPSLSNGLSENIINSSLLGAKPEGYVSPISISYLKTLDIQTEGITIEEELTSGSNYKRYIASYLSEGNKVYGLLTIPNGDVPDSGFPTIIFCHGYISPSQYSTTSGYVSYVDSLAKNGFIVFKIDYRGNGRSEGDATGSYFSSGYTIDVLSALRSLQTFDDVAPDRIGLWGHSMAGNLVLRSMEVSQDLKAGVIWAGAVYSYEDFAKYGISDSSYTHRPDSVREGDSQKNRETSEEIQKIRSDPSSIDFKNDFWSSISLTSNIDSLNNPIQIHHSVDDPVVNIGYSRDLEEVLKNADKRYEYYEYVGGGHNISSPYFESAMERTVEFFKENL